MGSYSEAVKADGRLRIIRKHRQNVDPIMTENSYINFLWLEEGLVIVQASCSCFSEGSRGMGAGRQVHPFQETAGLNATKMAGFCRKRACVLNMADRWRQA